MRDSLTPLHQGVIVNDLHVVKQYAQSDWQFNRDKMGFTPLQLAQLLGREACQRLLGGGAVPSHVLIQLKGSSSVERLTIREFQDVFNLIYRPFLTFSSYEMLKATTRDFPYLLRWRYLCKDNYEWGKQYGPLIESAALGSVSVKWIDNHLGYGLFAEKDMLKGTFIGEYTGLVRRLFRRHPDPNAYCLHYPTKLWSFKYYAIDAFLQGNLMRFINHSDRPNLQPLCVVNQQLLHLIFVTKHFVKAGSQLLFDYGEDYWQKRQKAIEESD